jgi:hypothetical protein
MFEISFVTHFGFIYSVKLLNYCISFFAVLGGLCSGYDLGFCLGNFFAMLVMLSNIFCISSGS